MLKGELLPSGMHIKRGDYKELFVFHHNLFVDSIEHIMLRFVLSPCVLFHMKAGLRKFCVLKAFPIDL